MEIKYWTQIMLLEAQTEGILLGFNNKNESKANIGDIYLVNSDGEISELLSVLSHENYFEEHPYRYKVSRHHYYKKTKKQDFIQELFKKYKTRNFDKIWMMIESESHCSAFIKVIKDDSKHIKDVLVAHSTWESYSEMLRIYKRLKIKYKKIF